MLQILILLAGAAGTSSSIQYPGAANRPEACHFVMEGAGMTLAVGGEVQAIAPGESARIDPRWTPYPSAWDEVPIRCLRGWRVSHPGIARLSRDRRTLRIAEDAPEGALITVSARYRGRPVTQQYRVIRAVNSPLVGTWMQNESSCSDETKVFEISFRRDGTFAVTFDTPMHSHVDYRGRWRTEGARLLLSDLVATRSDRPLPADIQLESGFVVGTEGELGFETAWHGTSGAHGTCRANFRKAN